MFNLGRTPLHYAAAHDDPSAVASLLDQGANIEARDKKDRTPLHYAAYFNREPSVVALLLDRGANIEAQDKFGQTPLHRAVGDNNLEVVSSLLDRGANIEALNNIGWTPLHWAAKWNDNPAVIALLVDRGADPMARTPDGHTAFIISFENKDLSAQFARNDYTPPPFSGKP